MDYASVLRGAEIFRDLTEDELHLVVALCSCESYSAGVQIAREGDEVKRVYVVERGHVQFQIRTGAGHLWTIASSTKGQCFGWKAFLGPPHTWVSSARCVEPTTLVTVDGPRLRELCRSHPRIGFTVMSGIARLVSQRLDDSRRQLAHMADRMA